MPKTAITTDYVVGLSKKSNPKQFYKLFAEKCPGQARQAFLMAWHILGEDWFEVAANKAQQLRLSQLDDYYRRTYGITLSDYDAMLSKQGGGCAICGIDKSGRDDGRFVVDHCHKSGMVRALLCCACNALVGFLETRKDILSTAMEYIRKHSDNLK